MYHRMHLSDQEFPHEQMILSFCSSIQTDVQIHLSHKIEKKSAATTGSSAYHLAHSDVGTIVGYQSVRSTVISPYIA